MPIRKIDKEYNYGKTHYRLMVDPAEVGDDGVTLDWGYSTNYLLELLCVEGWHSAGRSDRNNARLSLTIREIVALRDYLNDILTVHQSIEETK